jgi:hypothetical protein
MMMRLRSRAFGLAARPAGLGPGRLRRDAAPAIRPGVVLLGETHDRAADHRWQLAQIEALYARQPGLAIGLEMVPRSRQAALDGWTAGKLDEAQFLQAVDWQNSWGFDYACTARSSTSPAPTGCRCWR